MEKNFTSRLLAICLQIGGSENVADELFNNILKGLAVVLDYWSPNKFRNNCYPNKYKVRSKLDKGDFTINEWILISNTLKIPLDIIFRGGEIDAENIRDFATLYYLEPLNMTA